MAAECDQTSLGAIAAECATPVSPKGGEGAASIPTGKESFLTKKPIPTQADIEPTDSEREKIWADVVTKNAERSAKGLPERDVALMVELRLTRHRAEAYQNLLGPYLEVCLSDIQNPNGDGPSPADYRDAVMKAETQLEAATGIVSPKSKMATEVAGLARH